MQECSAFVSDAPAEKLISGVPRLYPDVRLTVRVMTVGEREDWKSRVRDASRGDASCLTNRYLADRIVDWDLSEPPSVETCGKLTPGLYDRIFAIVWGADGGDELVSGE